MTPVGKRLVVELTYRQAEELLVAAARRELELADRSDRHGLTRYEAADRRILKGARARLHAALRPPRAAALRKVAR